MKAKYTTKENSPNNQSCCLRYFNNIKRKKEVEETFYAERGTD